MYMLDRAHRKDTYIHAQGCHGPRDFLDEFSQMILDGEACTKCDAMCRTYSVSMVGTLVPS